MLRIRGMSWPTIVEAVRAGVRRPRWPTHLFLCIADHFEPDWRGADEVTQAARVRRWVEHYPRVVDGVADSRGRPPQHTFFYPAEAYRSDHLEQLRTLVDRGLGDVEVHLHHDNDSSEHLREMLSDYATMLHDRHGLLSRDESGQIRYGFIHGNWALDNSHPDGRWCGVNNELTVLRETGCYADFTMPAAPHPAQTRIANRIYYAVDDPDRPKSHDTGPLAAAGADPPKDGLLMIPGPLVLVPRGLGRPGLENGNLAGSQPPSAARIPAWVRAGVSVRGREAWLFVKLHTHGCEERNSRVLLGEPMRSFHGQLRATAAERGFAYHYVTAREMARLVSQASAGHPEPNVSRR